MMTLVFESVLRSLLMAATVWAGIKLLRVSSVTAQKIAWGLVLLCAFAMPFLMRFHIPNMGMALALPAHRVPPAAPPVAVAKSTAVAKSASVDSAPDTDGPFTAATPLDAIAPRQLNPAPAASTWSAAQLLRLLVPGYLAVSGLLLLRLFFGLAVALRIWHRAERASPILEPRASVRISASLLSPVTIGSGIVLPASYTEWDRAKLRLVLAHERAHVRQGDFYLQLLASLYAALVWFSPLGWWLKSRLADLGEAISDRAALAEVQDRSSYAEVLLEFAAMPRRSLIGVSAGVGMARSSKIQGRIERILNDRKFRLAFLGSRRHAAIAAVLVPIALVAATSLVRVEAARVMAVPPADIDDARGELSPVVPKSPVVHATPASARLTAAAPMTRKSLTQSTSQLSASQSSSAQSSSSSSSRSTSSDSDTQQSDSETFSYSDDDGDSYAIVSGTTGHVIGQGRFDSEFSKARHVMQGDYIWVERNGKSYVITDPALIAKSRELYKPEEELGQRQAALGESQSALGKQQARLGDEQAKVKVPPVDISQELARVEASLKELQALKTQEVSQKDLSEVQARLGELQGKLGEAEAKIAEKQAVLEGNRQSLAKSRQHWAASRRSWAGSRRGWPERLRGRCAH